MVCAKEPPGAETFGGGRVCTKRAYARNAEFTIFGDPRGRFEGFFMLAARFSSVAGSDRLIFLRRFPLLV